MNPRSRRLLLAGIVAGALAVVFRRKPSSVSSDVPVPSIPVAALPQEFVELDLDVVAPIVAAPASPRLVRKTDIAVVIALVGIAAVIVAAAFLLPQSKVSASGPDAPSSSVPSSGSPAFVKKHVVPNTSGPPCPGVDPCRIVISAINVATTVSPKPTEMMWDPFLGKSVASFGVPDNFTTTAWWSDGPLPGAAGMAVILGHHYTGGYGVFNDLDQLRSGDVVEVRVGHEVLDYQVNAIVGYLAKTDANALPDALSSHASQEDLALVSCIGAADPASRQIGANMIVFAKLVARAKVV